MEDFLWPWDVCGNEHIPHIFQEFAIFRTFYCVQSENFRIVLQKGRFLPV